MSSSQTHLESARRFLPLAPASEGAHWYAVHTKARHEKRVASQFEEKRVHTFLPLLRQIHRWSDRHCEVEVPMFSCYAFVCIVQTVEERLKVLRTPGVLGLVGCEGQGSRIPREEIESLQTAIRENIAFFPHTFISVGRRVRVRGGSLDGVEGILERHGAARSLIVSVELLCRSISIQVEGYDIELV